MVEENNENKPHSLELKLREVKGVMVIDLEGRLDLNASELIELIGWLLKRGKKKILLNFEQVELLDYSGLSVLAISYKNVQNHEGLLKFVAVPLHIEKLLRIAQLLEIFELYETLEMAIASFNRKDTSLSLPPLRRRFKRLGISNIAVSFVPAYRKEDPFFEGKAVNLGGEGLFLHAQKIFPLHTELILQLHLEKGEGRLTVKGVVIWLADKELQPHHYPGMGVRFHQLESDQQKRLIDFIDRNITQRSES